MNEIDKFFSQFIGQSQGQGRFLRLSVEDNLVGGTFIGRKGNQDYLKVKIDGLQLTGGGGVQSVTGLNTNNSDPQNPIVQISIGSGLSGNGTPSSPLTATGSGGTVISVGGLSPLFTVTNPTTTPTFSQISQTQNLVFASPNGSSGNPTFRALVASDIPSLSYVTSVGLSVPTGFSVSGSPVTSSGTLALSFAAGYSLPTNTSQTNWDTAYTNRITSLTTTGSGAATLISNVLNIPTPPTATFTSLTTTGSSGSSTLSSGVLNVPTYTLSGLGGQPLATNLTSLSGLTYASLAFVKMSAAGTFSLDTNTYLTANQTITLSGEATGSGTTSIGVTLTNSAVIDKVLTGYVSGAGTVAATDSILQAIQKLNGNIAAKTNTLTIFAANGTWALPLDSTTYFMPIQGGIGLPITTATTFLVTFTFDIEVTGLMIQHLNNTGIQGTSENFIFGIYNATDVVYYPFLNIQTNQGSGVSKNFQTFALSQAIPANKAICMYCTTPAWVTNPTQLVLRTTLLVNRT